MRKYARFWFAALSFGLVPATCGVLAAACSSDPVGIEACRSIESARCAASTACGVSEADATYCVSFYRDQCLHGLVNDHAEITSESTNACIAAIKAVETCARAGAMAMSDCSTVTLVAGRDPVTTLPCTIIKRSPEFLSACSFLQTTDDTSSSSSSSSTSSSSSSGSAADAGDDGG